MAKYFSLDVEKGENSFNSKMASFLFTLAIMVITIVLAVRFLWYVPLYLDYYGDPWADYKHSYTLTGTSKIKGFDTRSPAGHLVRTLKDEGITEMGEISYVKYLGSIDIGKPLPGGATWGLHLFKVEDYDGVIGDLKYITIAFLRGYERMLPGTYVTRLYMVSGTP